MKKLASAISKAAQDTAHFMQREIRHSARIHGWDEDVVRNTFVSYKDGKFSVSVSDSHADAAFVHEYGDESNRPTSVLRRYDHDNRAGTAFVKSLNRQLGGKL